MKTFTILILLAAFMAITNFGQTPPTEAGVPQTLAKWRAAHYSDVRYKLNITLEKGAPLMKGDIEIRVNIDAEGARGDLILDWRTTAFANDKDKPFANVVGVNDAVEILTSAANEHITIPKSLLKAGENVIKIQFASPVKTSGAAVTRYVDREDGAEYIYSLFVPSDASTAFPVFDQPDLKARFTLLLQTESGWKAVSNTKIISRTDRDCRQGSFCGTTHNFEETKPISTYVFAFAAGDFVKVSEPPAAAGGAVQINQNSSIEKSDSKNSNVSDDKLNPPAAAGDSDIYVRKSQAEKFKQHSAETFRLNREAVKYLETYFDYKYPFPKYDLVLIPEFPFGGMEHAGATFLKESSVIFPTEPTANDLVSRANLIFHEAAHQWFGDTVTMKWFDDLWLKEGFAEFMAYKTLEKVMPEYNSWKVFYERNKPLAYLTDSTRGTTPIYQEIPNLNAAKSAYGNIVYRKAPAFLRQAEFYLGEKEFQTAVRAFLKKHEFANAEWTDLVKEFETASGQDLKNWGESWVKQRGLPVIRIESGDMRVYRRIEEKNNALMHDTAEVYWFAQSDALGENKIWQMRLKTLLRYEGGDDEIVNVEISREKNPPFKTYWVMIVTNPKKPVVTPRLVFPNYQDYGYGIFLLDAKSREYVLKNIQNEKDDFLRSMMWGALWDSVREGELNPKDYVELAVKNISIEKDELTISTILSRVSTATNYYLSDAQRAEIAPKLENLLIEKVRKAPTLGARITFYRAFLNTSSSEKARMFLKDILGGKSEIKDLKLKTKDKFDIATRLAVLGDADAPRLLADLQKTETSDDAKRYAYAAGAAFPAREAKEKYFNDFLNNREISENWIESAFVPFNSARHSALTLPYLERALAELPNLKRNRKIFFVNGWLGAFIGGQKDEKALQIVNKFLADNPNLDKDLRLKILENVDALERAVKIRGKFGK